MDTTQIYAIVNEIASQAMGEKALAAVDAQGLIAMGNTVLSSSGNTEPFLNTLLQRIGRTIFSSRVYKNKFAMDNRSAMEWGAIVQKYSFVMPDAIEDPSYNLTEGKSVDQWKVYKGEVKRKIFVSRTPFMFQLTTPRYQLKEAFVGPAEMGAFLAGRNTAVRNRIEKSLEDLGRTAHNNMIAENDSRAVNLVTLYNTEKGLSGGDVLTAQTAMLNEEFMRFAISVIKQYIDELTDFSKLHNDGTIERFTPVDRQKLKVLSRFERRLETTVQWAAFQKEMVSLYDYSTVNYWQAEQTPMNINIERASDGTAKTINNIVATLSDVDSWGTYAEEEDVLTTPVNAVGAYYNTAWHMKPLYFNDTSENFVYFTLN